MKTSSMVLSSMRVCMLISLMTSGTPLSGAVKQDSTSIQLDGVTVKATPHKLATVQELKGSELQALSSTSIADALKYFAGVQIKDYGGLGGLKTINVRSLGAQHVGVYIDGIRITNAQNGIVDLGKFSLSTLESVSLYNANKLDHCQTATEYASGATVYLTTRRPNIDSLSVSARYASFHTYMGRINAQFYRHGWCGFIDGEYLNSKGDYPFRYKSQYEDTVGFRKNSDIDYFRAEAAVFKNGFSSHLYYYQSERGCPGGIVRRLSDKYVNIGREWDIDLFVQSSYRAHPSKKTEIITKLKYTHEYLRYCTDYIQNQNTAKVNNHYYQNDAFVSVSGAYYPLEGISINLAYDARMSWLDADLKHFSTVRRLDQKAVAAAQLRIRGFRAAASLLYQHYKDRSHLKVGAAEPLSRFTPSLTFGYSYKDLSFRVWYKTIFRAPTLNDLYYTQAGNRNLKPEYTRQFNMGLEYKRLFTKLYISAQADMYINRIDDRIVCLPIKGTYTWSMMNYGKTFCRGLNITSSARYFSGNWNFSLLGSLTWQRDLNRTDPDNQSSYNKPICYSPALSFGVTEIAEWKNYSITISELHVGERMWSYADPEDVLSPYNNIDLKLSCHFNQFMVSLEINDALNIQYEHIPRYPMPGRNFRLTLTYNI